jgi:serine phosphatase RsbU (regulator of sigma subunit)/catechol 2,3-dioxygenase-like lactoylglutathione lyase family enzyme
MERPTVRLDQQGLFLHLHFVIVFVRDQERSLRFYLDQLGFRLVVDQRFESGDRWIEVAPPDGTANLALVAAKPGSNDYNLIGRPTQIFFLTEDVPAKFQEWSERGVRFQFPPQKPAWGGIFTRFEDVDGNSFGLAGFDEVRRGVEEHRRAVAQKLEADRRAAQELEIAKQVQARLFPQVMPVCRTVDYSGICIQARQVGGDYYDFLDLGQERLGLIIGDISGKGIAAALLMANLQANLRSQCAIALEQPERLLRLANELFYNNTADTAYATLFFAEYEPKTQCLRYANCGHLSPLLLRNNGAVEQLESTATVLGLFKNWACSIEERHISAGDVLVIYTDGVTEAFDEQGQEFGEQRLIEAVRLYRDLPPEDLLTSLIRDVQRFSPDGQSDDITLIVAKFR